MKYILYPPIAVLIVIAVFLWGFASMFWDVVWHFRRPSLRKTFTDDIGECIFDDWSWKEFFDLLFNYNKGLFSKDEE